MATMPWDAQGEARAALRAIVDDSRYGSAALSNAQSMTNLLKDMLPDAPGRIGRRVGGAAPGARRRAGHHRPETLGGLKGLAPATPKRRRNEFRGAGHSWLYIQREARFRAFCGDSVQG